MFKACSLFFLYFPYDRQNRTQPENAVNYV